MASVHRCPGLSHVLPQVFLLPTNPMPVDTVCRAPVSPSVQGPSSPCSALAELLQGQEVVASYRVAWERPEILAAGKAPSFQPQSVLPRWQVEFCRSYASALVCGHSEIMTVLRPSWERAE